MRIPVILLSLALLTACATGQPDQDDEFITRIGTITGKEVVELDQAKSQSRVSTGVSISSGGGVSVGIGFLVSSLFSGSSDKAPVRYHVKVMDGEVITVYHESDVFQVGDCVEVSSLANDEDKNPPLMKRIEGGCN